MKKMICEVCGESDFLKENGVFVCQTCGMKYSLAEAKNLLKKFLILNNLLITLRTIHQMMTIQQKTYVILDVRIHQTIQC